VKHGQTGKTQPVMSVQSTGESRVVNIRQLNASKDGAGACCRVGREKGTTNDNPKLQKKGKIDAIQGDFYKGLGPSLYLCS